MKAGVALPRGRTARPAHRSRREWWGAHSAHARRWALRKLHGAYGRFKNVNLLGGFRRPHTNIVKCLPDGQRVPVVPTPSLAAPSILKVVGSQADICSAKGHVRFGSKADICAQSVRFTPKGGYRGRNYSFVSSFIVITPSSRWAVNETLSPGFTASNIRAS